ncbi:pyridoxamine 5'-phosphate oxidase family protein [Aurantiacibacter sp. MUD61]|uniref:pyridoxamine 5'-phosphate oxidase family protein n=1 Tax=Aurantiacibacter sp. MUD61 TaxID=3009083 RepID=UPI0022F129EB|nr:pyridoxamine 5'-phosphate oxidase family protein [Aurantiacibacter sp. MUD61]
MYETFDQIADDIAGRLEEAANSRHSPMHTPVVATRDADARVMVLRAYDRATRTLRFHTDARSLKCDVIGEGAPVGVLLYDQAAKIQLRCRGTGRIERDGPIADAAWEASTTFARRCYLGDGPGTEVEQPSSGLPEWVEGRQPTEEEVAPAREHFAVLLVELAVVDWFFLSNDGHRRAVIDMVTRVGRWITP